MAGGMADSPKPGELYWSLIEPYWLALNESWDHGPAQFLSALHNLPERTQYLYAAHWCQSEVTNGGFFQFFFNTTGILAPEAAVGFSKIGAGELGDIVTEAQNYFGATYPRHRLKRMAKLPETEGRKRAEWDPFGHLDNRFYAWFDAEKNRWERMADRYASDA
jgi:hypothetical protein